jgi:hypothetical protein
VIGLFVGIKPSVSRSEIMDSFGAGNYSMGVVLGIVSCGPVASNEPS